MQIKRSGFMYRCAYGLIDEEKRPILVNLCPFFWKFVWMFFCGWILYWVIMAVVHVICYGGGFFFAYRGATNEEFEQCQNLFAPYKSWPTTASGKRILPIWFVLGGVAIWLIYAHGATATTATMDLAASLAKPTFWRGFAGTAICFTVALLAYRFFTSEVWRIFRAWCKAKKDRICPIIQVVE